MAVYSIHAHCSELQLLRFAIRLCFRYVNQPEPELQGSSVTLTATDDRIQQMHQEADQIWTPELAQLMKVNCHDEPCFGH